MTFSQLVVADIKAFHALLLELGKNFKYFLRPIRRLKLERYEYLCDLRVVVSIDKLCGRSWVDDGVQRDKAVENE